MNYAEQHKHTARAMRLLLVARREGAPGEMIGEVLRVLTDVLLAAADKLHKAMSSFCRVKGREAEDSDNGLGKAERQQIRKDVGACRKMLSQNRVQRRKMRDARRRTARPPLRRTTPPSAAASGSAARATRRRDEGNAEDREEREAQRRRAEKEEAKERMRKKEEELRAEREKAEREKEEREKEMMGSVAEDEEAQAAIRAAMEADLATYGAAYGRDSTTYNNEDAAKVDARAMRKLMRGGALYGLKMPAPAPKKEESKRAAPKKKSNPQKDDGGGDGGDAGGMASEGGAAGEEEGRAASDDAAHSAGGNKVPPSAAGASSSAAAAADAIASGEAVSTHLSVGDNANDASGGDSTAVPARRQGASKKSAGVCKSVERCR